MNISKLVEHNSISIRKCPSEINNKLKICVHTEITIVASNYRESHSLLCNFEYSLELNYLHKTVNFEEMS
jgi:hypothetical protein